MHSAQPTPLPRHIAIVMDGNGRWAKQRGLPRVAGHEAGAKSIQQTIRSCAEKGIEVLTIFAFSAENWGRPQAEVDALMQLFIHTLQQQTDELTKHHIQLRVMGDRSRFPAALQDEIARSEQKTAGNTGLTLVIAANYSGRWDITQATRAVAQKVTLGELSVDAIDEAALQQHLSMSDLPEPDLLIRTSGEIRISNFLLWQIAYAELYFTPILWPDFDERALEDALAFYAKRERRFGLTQDQLKEGALPC